MKSKNAKVDINDKHDPRSCAKYATRDVVLLVESLFMPTNQNASMHSYNTRREFAFFRWRLALRKHSLRAEREAELNKNKGAIS